MIIFIIAFSNFQYQLKPNEMNGFILPYLGQISQLKDRIARLEQGVQMYKQQLKIMSEILKANQIKYDMALKMPELPDICKQIPTKDTKKQTVAEKINSNILNEMLDICFRVSTKNSYSEEYKAFAYSLYCSSELCYRSLRSHFPLPSESCLRKSFQPAVIDLENHLSSIDDVHDLLLKRSDLYQIPKDSKIKCTLVIDAFTTTTITPYCKKKNI